jgi:hypothetical protein
VLLPVGRPSLLLISCHSKVELTTTFESSVIFKGLAVLECTIFAATSKHSSMLPHEEVPSIPHLSEKCNMNTTLAYNWYFIPKFDFLSGTSSCPLIFVLLASLFVVCKIVVAQIARFTFAPTPADREADLYYLPSCRHPGNQ